METPVKRVTRSTKATLGTPICIPATPLLQRLGFGTGVEVYRLQRTPNKNVIKSPWAVKRLTRRGMASENDKIYSERLLKEAAILKKLKHPNIIGFRGIVKDDAGRTVLALEICSTSLHDIIEQRMEDELGPLPSLKTAKVIVDVAKALDYLHATALILHGDMKGQNVLINGDFEICKLCDFGVSSPLTKEGDLDLMADPYANYVGTDLWGGPEVFEDDATIITSKTDIFAFGCVIYEMLTLTPPHLLQIDGEELSENMDSSFEEDSFNMKMEKLRGTRPHIPEELPLGDDYCRILEMFFLCTNALPEQRPCAKDIYLEMESSE